MLEFLNVFSVLVAVFRHLAVRISPGLCFAGNFHFDEVELGLFDNIDWVLPFAECGARDFGR